MYLLWIFIDALVNGGGNQRNLGDDKMGEAGPRHCWYV